MHRPVLRHPASHATAKGLGDALDVVLQPGQMDDVRGGADVTQASADVDAVLVAQIGVDHRHVDPAAGHDRKCLRAGCGDAHQIQVTLRREPCCQRLRHHRVVVDDEHAYLHADNLACAGLLVNQQATEVRPCPCCSGIGPSARQAG